jgi:hypothetical protein
MIPPIQLGISVGITGLQIPDYKGNGGEGGTKTRLLKTPITLVKRKKPATNSEFGESKQSGL